jgi:dTDP-glucose pyrophosphorylase
MVDELDSLLVPEGATIRDAMTCIDAGRIGIALVSAPDRKLVGTVTDGDIRRAMLADFDLDAPVRVLLERQRELHEPRPLPLTAPAGATAAELLVIMRHYDVRHIPIVDGDGRVSELALLEELIDVGLPPLRAVVMAGGFGKRLGSLTEETPKPMLPVGDRPLLERIVEQLRDAGIRHVNLTTHYRADAIARHFGDGSRFGVEIEYVSEERPLGTAGALGLVDSHEPLLIMNGDILTTVDFRAMHRFHDEHEADMTVAVRRYELQLPYGLVELADVDVSTVTEKPLVRGFANAGIYLIDPTVAKTAIPRGRPLEMPELIHLLLERGRRVVGFPLREYWLDIGQIADYERAMQDASAGGL